MKIDNKNIGGDTSEQIKERKKQDESSKLNLVNLQSNLESIGATVKGDDFPVTATLNKQNFVIDKSGNTTIVSDEYLLREGIEIGDYITYIPPKDNGTVKTYQLSAGASWYTSNQSITQQYNIWRVLNKNTDGSLDIIPAFKDNEVTYTSVQFRDAKGWNNAPYILDDMCNYLYSDKEKGIIARSIDQEDITSNMIEGIEGTTASTSTGIKKITKSKSERIKALSKGNYIQDIDIDNNTVIYKNGYTSYPTLYFDVKDNLSNPFYTSDTIDTNISSNGRIASKPTTLSVEHNLCFVRLANTDFLNFNAYSVLFETGNDFWIATRSVLCTSNGADFCLPWMGNSSSINHYLLFNSSNHASSANSHVCPIVSIGPKVPVTKCEGKNSQSNRHLIDAL